MENNTHEGNYRGTADMEAENQDMAFVNDTLENAKTSTNIMKDDLSENNEEEQLNLNGGV